MDYLELKFWTSFRSFARQRADLSAVLTGAGKELERTVLFYALWLARHERTHIKQIERIVDAIR